MNIIFLTMTDIPDLECRYIYTELMKVFIKNGHSVTIVSPSEKTKKKYHIYKRERYTLIKIKMLQGAKSNLIKKGLNTVFLESWYIRAIKKCLNTQKFDLVLYSTPPITLCRAVNYLKKRDGAVTYLMLKDIFPQNALDLHILEKKGWKKILYYYFRQKEKRLYQSSDFIGCMSPENTRYLLQHNEFIDKNKVGLCVNSVQPLEERIIDKEELRKKQGIPKDKIAFFYGGNFGKPQGVDYLIKLLDSVRNNEKCFFVLCGDGAEYFKIRTHVDNGKFNNVLLINGLPKQEYDALLQACDVGMIFLDYNFTIPNYPSRILPYMEYGIPVFAATDEVTDIKDAIQEGEFGWWCPSNNVKMGKAIIEDICNQQQLAELGLNGRKYLMKYFTADITYKQIMEKINHGD